MKKLMFAMVAALSFAVVAQDAPGAKPEGDAGVRRPPRDRMAMMGAMAGDPAVMAVMNPKVAEKIGLSKETLDQLKKIDKENRDRVRELQSKTRAAAERQAKLMKAEKIDEAAVMAAIDELFESRREVAKSQARRLIATKALLTPEQLAKAAEEMKLLREERRGGNRRSKARIGDKPEGDKPLPPPPPEAK